MILGVSSTFGGNSALVIHHVDWCGGNIKLKETTQPQLMVAVLLLVAFVGSLGC